MNRNHMRKYFTLLAAALLLAPLGAWASGLTISAPTVNQAAQTVSFSINWNNSWNVTAAPANWDAAWVFIKWRVCGAAPSVPWNHAAISTTIGEHTTGTLQFTDRTGAVDAVDAAPNNTGAFLRRASTGVFPTSSAVTVTLKTTGANAIPTTGDIDVKIFGIEMVYVPQAAFLIGDGQNSYYKYDLATISSEAATTVTWSGGGENSALHADYPKGFAPFYCMKYEITAGQYAGFLNTLPASAQSARFLQNVGNYRNTITATGAAPDYYETTRTDRAQGHMVWNDFAAYLDWACLRPMSELEYEKACRGLGLAVVGQYAWGTTTLTQATTINTTTEDGTEEVSNAGANCRYGSNNLISGDGGQGPLRAGIFSKPTSNSRVLTGSTYYGIMEMSGNVNELVISCENIAAGPNVAYSPPSAFLRTAAGFLGDGDINNASGTHNQAAWPPSTMTYVYAVWQMPVGTRGGSFAHNWDQLQISARNDIRLPTCDYVNRSNNGQYYIGGRGVR